MYEIVDYGLGNIEKYGLEKWIFVSNDDYALKKFMLPAGRVCPLHLHPEKTETYIVEAGRVYVLILGEERRVLYPKDQVTVPKGKWHTFVSLDRMSLMFEISSKAEPEKDRFANKFIRR